MYQKLAAMKSTEVLNPWRGAMSVTKWMHAHIDYIDARACSHVTSV